MVPIERSVHLARLVTYHRGIDMTSTNTQKSDIVLGIEIEEVLKEIGIGLHTS